MSIPQSRLNLQSLARDVSPKGLHNKMKEWRNQYHKRTSWLKEDSGQKQIGELYDIISSTVDLYHPLDRRYSRTGLSLADRFYLCQIARLGINLTDAFAKNHEVVSSEVARSVLNYDHGKNDYGKNLTGICVDLATLKGGSVFSRHFRANACGSVLFQPYLAFGTLVTRGKASIIDDPCLRLLQK